MTVIAITFKFSMCYTILTSDQTDGEQTVWLVQQVRNSALRQTIILSQSLGCRAHHMHPLPLAKRESSSYIKSQSLTPTTERLKHLSCIFDVSHDVCKPWPSPLEIEESFLQFDALCPTLDVYLDWVTISILHFADDVLCPASNCSILSITLLVATKVSGISLYSFSERWS